MRGADAPRAISRGNITAQAHGAFRRETKVARAHSLILLAGAVLVGLLAVLLAARLLAPPATPAAAAPAVPLTKIAVAAAAIPTGAPIDPALVRLADWPANAVPAGAFASLAELVDAAEPRVALRPVEANEPILASRVTGRGGRFSVSSLIDPTMRAATIRVNDVAGVGGFVLPGDRVDVLVIRPASGGGGSVSDVLLQNVPVLGLDQDVDDRREGPAVVKAATLEVSQQAAQKLALAQQVGTLSLALRSTRSGAASDAPVRTIGLQDLRDDAPPAAASAMSTRRVRASNTPPRHIGAQVTIVRGLRAHSYAVAREGEMMRGGQ